MNVRKDATLLTHTQKKRWFLGEILHLIIGYMAEKVWEKKNYQLVTC